MSVITANLNILTVEVLTFYGTIGWVHKMIWFNKNKIIVCFEVLYVADMFTYLELHKTKILERFIHGLQTVYSCILFCVDD